MPMLDDQSTAPADDIGAIGAEEFQDLLLAANKGDASAQYAVGLIYHQGRYDLQIQDDPTEGIRWLLAAAEQNHADAQFSLGWVLSSDQPNEIIRWFRAAAENGHAQAAWHLGQEYAIGNPIARDLQEAVRWYRVAADLGFASAQESLGNAYSKGNGIEQDLAAATYWLGLAAANPNKFLDPDDGDTKGV